MTVSAIRVNPFFAASTLPFQAPPFDEIEEGDYQPAIEEGMRQQIAEVAAIIDNPAAATFDNTIVALERSGELLNRVLHVFSAEARSFYDLDSLWGDAPRVQWEPAPAAQHP